MEPLNVVCQCCVSRAMAEEQLVTGHSLEPEESQISVPLGTPVRPTMPYDRGISTPVGGNATPARQALFQGLEFSTPGASGIKGHSGYEGFEEDCAVCLEPLGDDSLQHTMHCKVRHRCYWCEAEASTLVDCMTMVS